MKKIWMIIGIISLLTATPTGSLSAQPLPVETDGPLSTLSRVITSLSDVRVAHHHIPWHSPAGCVAQPQWPHISSTEGHGSIISYKGDLKCETVITKFEMEVWGDRHTWLGWRQHTDGHHTEIFYNKKKDTIRTTKEGRRGTYTYKTRLRVRTFENGRWSFVRDLSSDVNVRISCPGSGGRCTEITRGRGLT